MYSAASLVHLFFSQGKTETPGETLSALGLPPSPPAQVCPLLGPLPTPGPTPGPAMHSEPRGRSWALPPPVSPSSTASGKGVCLTHRGPAQGRALLTEVTRSAFEFPPFKPTAVLSTILSSESSFLGIPVQKEWTRVVGSWQVSSPCPLGWCAKSSHHSRKQGTGFLHASWTDLGRGLLPYISSSFKHENSKMGRWKNKTPLIVFNEASVPGSRPSGPRLTPASCLLLRPPCRPTVAAWALTPGSTLEFRVWPWDRLCGDVPPQGAAGTRLLAGRRLPEGLSKLGWARDSLWALKGLGWAQEFIPLCSISLTSNKKQVKAIYANPFFQ